MSKIQMSYIDILGRVIFQENVGEKVMVEMIQQADRINYIHETAFFKDEELSIGFKANGKQIEISKLNIELVGRL